MKRCTVELLNFTRQCGNKIEVWWKILFWQIPQLSANPKVKSGPHLPKSS